MFLNLLQTNEKNVFWALSKMVILADNKVDAKEAEMTELMKKELQFSDSDVAKIESEAENNLDKLCAVFSTHKSKTAAFLELMSLCYSDNDFVDAEQILMDKVALNFNFSKEKILEMEIWVKKILVLTNEGLNFFNENQ